MQSINVNKTYSCDFETLVLSKNEIKQGKKTYVWLWGSYKIYGNEKEHVELGNNISSFMEHIKTLKNPVLYFHNLKFDGSFIVNWLFENGYEYSKDKRTKCFNTLISGQGQWYAIEIFFKVSGHKTVKATIYDSLKKLPFTVDSMARAYGLDSDTQKLKIDYKSYRSENHNATELEKRYITNDVKIVGKVLKMNFDEGMLSITTGGDSLKAYKELIGENNFNRSFPIIDLETDKMLRKSFMGGWVYCNSLYATLSTVGEIGKCFNVDKNSMHPSMMCERELPYGLPNYFEGEYAGKSKCYIQHMLCRFKVKDRYVPTIQIKKNPKYCDTEYLTDNRVKDDLGYIDEQVELWLTSVDVELMYKHYDVSDEEFIDGFEFKHCKGKFFNEYIALLMKIKENSEGAKRLSAKLKMNALYGKFGTNPNITGKIPYQENGVLKFKKPTHIENGVEVLEEEFRDPIYLPMAIFITAWSRHDVITTIDDINANYISGRSDKDRFIYADTDSIHITGWHIPKCLKVHETHLDYWKAENYNIGAKYLRQKTYCDKVIVKTEKDFKKYMKILESNRNHVGYQQGKLFYLDIKCAGMPDGVKEDVTYDNFNVGFKSNKKLQGHQVKGGVVLTDDDFEIKQKIF